MVNRNQLSFLEGQDEALDPWFEPEPPRDRVQQATIEPRYYQTETVRRTLELFRTDDPWFPPPSVLNVLPTGMGKTVIAALLAMEVDGRALFLAHREELLDQTMAAMEAITGEVCGLEKAESWAGRERIVCASVQTLCKERRLKRFLPHTFKLIIVDEAHHAVAPTYDTILSHFTTDTGPHATWIMGLTATPDRQDEKALGRRFDEVGTVIDIADAIKDGWLVRLLAKQVSITEVHLENVRMSHGDFVVSALDAEVRKGVDAIVAETLRLAGDRTGILFWPGVLSAQYAAEKFNSEVSGSAIFISGETPKDERKVLVDGFRAGRSQYLCNCAIATEGFDAPIADFIGLCRPSKSRALVAQMIGRGTRALPGVLDGMAAKAQAAERCAAIAASKKPNTLILDFVYNLGKHAGTLVTPQDVLGGSYDDDVVKAARKKLALGETEDALELLDAAKDLARQQAEALRKQARQHKARVKSNVQEIDPFAEAGVPQDDVDHVVSLDGRYGQKPPTPGQREALIKFGVLEAQVDRMTKRQASLMLDRLVERSHNDLATLKQLRHIRRYCDAPDTLSFARGKAAMDYIQRAIWRKEIAYTPETLQRICHDQRQPGEEG